MSTFKVGDKVRRIASERRGAWAHVDRVLTVKEVLVSGDLKFEEINEQWWSKYFELVSSSIDERIKELEFQLAALHLEKRAGFDAAKKKAVERWLGTSVAKMTVEEGGYTFTFGVES